MSQVLMQKIHAARRLDAEALIDLRQIRVWRKPDGDPPGGNTPPGAGDPPPASDLPPTSSGDEPPDWMRDPLKVQAELTKLRNENAKLRVEKKPTPESKPAPKPDDPPPDKVAALEADFRKLQNDLAAERLNNLRLKVASEAGLPAGSADRLKGTTEDELKADAAALKALFPAPAPGSSAVPGGQRTTSPIPGGPPANETDAQKRARLFGR